MAKIIRFHEFGGPQVLKVDDIDVPEPGRNISLSLTIPL